MPAAVAASVDAVVAPVVMNELKPGRGIDDPLGITTRSSSSATASMPTPRCGSGRSSASRQRSRGMQRVGMLEAEEVVEARADACEQRLHPAGLGQRHAT